MKAIIEFIRGLSVTIRHLFSHAITLQYPKERWSLPERFRGVQRLRRDEQGEGYCAGCCLCACYCPAKAIEIETYEAEDFTKKVSRFEIDISRCIFCGLCVEICPKEALVMSGEYELAAYSREELVYTKERLYQGPTIVKYRA